jgi:hypothetical protein
VVATDSHHLHLLHAASTANKRLAATVARFALKSLDIESFKELFNSVF